MPDLLIELFSEEIPARMQRKAANDFKSLLTNALVDAGVTYEAATPYWTPRRLTLDIRGVDAKSKDVREERKGPRIDAPEKAIEGFLRGAGLLKLTKWRFKRIRKKENFMCCGDRTRPRDGRDCRGGHAKDHPKFSLAKIHALGCRILSAWCIKMGSTA